MMMKTGLFLLATLALNPAFGYGQITHEEFQVVKAAMFQAFPSVPMKINTPEPYPGFWWEQDRTYASYVASYREDGTDLHVLFYFGGLARMPEMTLEGAALVLCHELSHGIGGAPLKEGSLSSIEGQADYYATRYCLPKVLKLLPAQGPAPKDPIGLCQTETCRRTFVAIQSDMSAILSHPGSKPLDVDFSKKDPKTVTEIDTRAYAYPSDQCRLDTLVAGALEQPRPRCWWAPEL